MKFAEACMKKARKNFLKWKENGRIRTGLDFQNMKKSRREFKDSINYCKQNEIRLKKQRLLESFKEEV